MPSGNSMRKSASRSTVRVAPMLGVALRRRVLTVAVRLLVEVLLVAFLDVPTTPCVILRCAPSAAARVKVLPHSGQLSVAAVVADVPFAVAIGALRFQLFPTQSDGTCAPRVARRVTVN